MKKKGIWLLAPVIIVLLIVTALTIRNRVQNKEQPDTAAAGTTIAVAADNTAGQDIKLPESKTGSSWKSVGDTEELAAYAYGTAENERFLLCMKENGEIAVWDKEEKHLYASNPVDQDQDSVAKAINKVNLGSQAYVEFVDQNGATAAANTLGGAVGKGNVSYEPIEGGVKFWYYFDTYDVLIAVDYILEEDGIKVEFPFEDIRERISEGAAAPDKSTTSYWGVMSISLLPYFSAAGMQDEGYLFVPDGSGALMYHNNNKAGYSPYSQEVYSREPSLNLERQTNSSKSIRMPVFGTKIGDNGFLAVITSGEASATINAMTSGVLTSYNNVYPKFVYRQVATAVTSVSNRYGGAGAIGANLVTAIYPQAGSFSVKYYLLHEEGLDYVDMAECYRNYLIEEKGLEKQSSVSGAPFYLNLYGGLEIEKYVLGFKTDYLQKMTTYKEAEKILQELLDKGIDQIAFKYTGWQKHGIESEIPADLEFESSLGGKKDYEELAAFIKEKGISFFPDIDLLNFWQTGNGYSLFNDAALSIQQTPAYQYRYDLNTLKKYAGSKWRLLTPVKVYDAFERLTGKYGKMQVNNISLTTLGTMVYSDFSQKSTGICRDDTAALWEDILTEAGEKYDSVMVDGGNVYAAAKASHIFGAATKSTGYDMADESIPFYQIVLHGYVSYSTEPINLSADTQKEMLKALETGSSLAYSLMYGDPYEIVETKYNFLYSANYKDWIATMEDQYKRTAPVLEAVSDKTIVEHKMLGQKVYKTVFEDGSTVYVNYGKNTVTEEGHTIGATDFVFIPATE